MIIIQLPKSVIILCFFVFFTNCREKSKDLLIPDVVKTEKKAIETSTPTKKHQTIDYDFTQASQLMYLSASLQEISGLTIDESNGQLLAVNDEKGKIYFLSPTTGEILEVNKFGSDGDYEGIAKIDSSIYIAKNNGNLCKYNPQTKESITIKTKLSKVNNIEGLCSSADQKLLLIACKGSPLSHPKSNKQKAIYAFNINKNKLSTTPYISIHDKEILAFAIEQFPKSSITEMKSINHRLKQFSPSGIAIQPETKEYFIISAKGSTLIIFDKKKKIKRIVLLSDKKIPQPEGICFNQKNDLYISSEGRGFSGKLFMFKAIIN